MSKFQLVKTSIKDLFVIEPKVFEDNRGYFMESYNEKDFYSIGIRQKFKQANESFSYKGTVRGLHFQLKYPQGKLVRVTRGKVYDVAVDLRRKSPTFGRYYSIILSSNNKKQMYIPEGFAHGFMVLSEYAQFLYKCTEYYNKEYENGIIWNDPDLSIKWPLGEVDNVILSQKDQKWKKLKNTDINF